MIIFGDDSAPDKECQVINGDETDPERCSQYDEKADCLTHSENCKWVNKDEVHNEVSGYLLLFIAIMLFAVYT
eukprot:UN02170